MARPDLDVIYWPSWLRATSSHGAAAEWAEREAFEAAAAHLRAIRARGAMRQRVGPVRAAAQDRANRHRRELEALAFGAFA